MYICMYIYICIYIPSPQATNASAMVAPGATLHNTTTTKFINKL